MASSTRQWSRSPSGSVRPGSRRSTADFAAVKPRHVAGSDDGQTEALDELSRPQQRAIIGAGVVQTLLAAALGLRRRPSEQVRGSKQLWAVAALVDFVGPPQGAAVYLWRCDREGRYSLQLAKVTGNAGDGMTATLNVPV